VHGRQKNQLSLTNRATSLYKRDGVRGWPPKTPVFPLPCQIWSYCVTLCRHKYRRWEAWL